jgi:hypothetical protein
VQKAALREQSGDDLLAPVVAGALALTTTQLVEIHQQRKVVQVLWLVVQVLVQREEVQVAVAPPTTLPRVSSSQSVSLARLSFLNVFFINPPVGEG